MMVNASPDTYEILLDLVCYQSYNPIATALERKGDVEKKVRKENLKREKGESEKGEGRMENGEGRREKEVKKEIFKFFQIATLYEYEAILQWKGIALRLEQRAVR